VLRRGTSSLEIDCAEKMFCEQYVAKDLENELGLSRERLALLALLLGSDYTEGISGIGIVNAMETLAAFPTIDDLVSFKDWLDSPDIDQFRAVTQAARRKEGDGMYELPPASHLHDSLAADVGANASAGNHLHPQHHCCTVAWSSSHIESPHRVTKEQRSGPGALSTSTSWHTAQCARHGMCPITFRKSVCCMRTPTPWLTQARRRSHFTSLTSPF
jgi:hypothetical protein